MYFIKVIEMFGFGLLLYFEVFVDFSWFLGERIILSEKGLVYVA